MSKIIDWFNFAAIALIIEIILLVYLPTGIIENVGIQPFLFAMIILVSLLFLNNRRGMEFLFTAGALTLIASIALAILGNTQMMKSMIEIGALWIIIGFVMDVMTSKHANNRTFKINFKFLSFQNFVSAISNQIKKWYVSANLIKHGQSIHSTIKKPNQYVPKFALTELRKRSNLLSWFVFGMAVLVIEWIVSISTLPYIGYGTWFNTTVGVVCITLIIFFVNKLDSRYLIMISLLSLASAMLFILIDQTTLSNHMSTYTYLWLTAGILLQTIRHLQNSKSSGKGK